MSDHNQTLYSDKIQAGSRTYFLDVKQGKDGVKYLTITETRSSDGELERNRVMVFEEHFETFFAQLIKITEFLGLDHTDRLDEIRQTHPNAYKKWTPEEDAHLKQSYAQGLSIDVLATTFQRQPSAIRSRLIKLGLLSHS